MRKLQPSVTDNSLE